jgi:phosphatidylserine decarboxylase
MTWRSMIVKIVQQQDLNFFFTNRIPRRTATRFIGWFSKIENPLICGASLWLWRLFSDLDLSDSRETHFRSMHHCFTRSLKDGARPVETDPAILVSPCDAIIGASGQADGTTMLQIKGSTYSLADLLGSKTVATPLLNAQYVTLRLTAGMYHHFHAPHDCRVSSVTHIGGDTWNVNPIALSRVERLFCRNERAVIRTILPAGGHAVTLVPVAAILVAGIRLRFLDMPVQRNRPVSQTFPCDASFHKGEEMGWFEHGSTIIVLAPSGFSLCANIRPGATIRAGQPLMRLPQGSP